ncbi:RanGTP-binding protein-domain-containing protein [Dichotomocladium elegans]|nr:RanGTP-binding protein-domain-containing protein [Dichotomocladium elegans]
MTSLEDLFSKLALSTVNTVSRIAISHATNAAIVRFVSLSAHFCLIARSDNIHCESSNEKNKSKELDVLQRQFDLKIKNLKPTIDIIAHSVADGNRDLEPTLELCNDLERNIDEFAAELGDPKATNTDEYVRQRLKTLLQTIDNTVPSLHLALRNLPGKSSVSLSRLLQASAILTSSITAPDPFVLRMYSLFAAGSGNVLSWKEEFAKCTLVPKQNNGYHNVLEITEDLNDGRFHEEGEKPRVLTMDLTQLKRMYYTRSGTLLNLDDSKESVLVIKVLKKKERQQSKADSPSSPAAGQIKAKEVDPEIERDELSEADWYALEIWKDNTEDDSDEEEKEEGQQVTVEAKESKLQTSGTDGKSLLLLEAVIRLSLLETSEKMNHLNASDDLIRLYMSE